MTKDTLILSEAWGTNATIPLCAYCEKEKDAVYLLGKRGEELAKQLGYKDGHMPAKTALPLDFCPCKACRDIGIGCVEIEDEDCDPPVYTGQLWLLKKEAVRRLLVEDAYKRAEKAGFMIVSKDFAASIGLPAGNHPSLEKEVLDDTNTTSE